MRDTSRGEAGRHGGAGSRAGVGLHAGAFILDLVILLILIVIGTTIVATAGGVRLGLEYRELLGGGVSPGRIIDGSFETYVESKVEEVSQRLVTQVAENFIPEATDRMTDIVANEMIRRFEPRIARFRFYLEVDDSTLPNAIDEAFDAVVAAEDPDLPADEVNALRDEVQVSISELRLDEFLPSVVAFARLLAATPVAILALYFLVEAFAGATFGKMALGLVIALPDGSRAYMGAYLYRFAVKNGGPLLVLLGLATGTYALVPIGAVVTAAVVLGSIAILGAGRRSLHDYISGTAVYRRIYVEA